MPTEELTCNGTTISEDTLPPHLYICCGFEEYPAAFKGTWALESKSDKSCVDLYGTGGSFTLSREPCGTIYSTPGLPFYVVLPTPNPLCCGNPNEENEHIHNWGVGPGSVVYGEDNYCQRDPETGEVAFFLSAEHVGADCLFSISITEAIP